MEIAHALFCILKLLSYDFLSLFCCMLNYKLIIGLIWLINTLELLLFFPITWLYFRLIHGN